PEKHAKTRVMIFGKAHNTAVCGVCKTTLFDYESRGRGFESLLAHHENRLTNRVRAVFCFANTVLCTVPILTLTGIRYLS
ncbi:MAG: hypothetical protein RRY08_06285, partial [Christensenella sp.]